MCSLVGGPVIILQLKHDPHWTTLRACTNYHVGLLLSYCRIFCSISTANDCQEKPSSVLKISAAFTNVGGGLFETKCRASGLALKRRKGKGVDLWSA